MDNHSKSTHNIIHDGYSNEELMAAIDIGSNSFHLAIARLDHGEVRKVASMSEKVQLGAGLDDNNLLSEEAGQRGLDCLNRFVGRLESVAPHRLRVVATNALRRAKNSDEFIAKANAILPKPIEIIAGREEARLIYLGVSHTNASSDQRLVIDIGGGSTEFIIGEKFEPILTESLQLGCVSFTKMCFEDGKITEVAFEQAKINTKKVLMTISNTYKGMGWSSVTGSSGTIKAVSRVLNAKGWSSSKQGVTYEAVKRLEKLLLKIGHVDDIDLEGVKEHRKAVLPAGVAILCAIMEELDVDTLNYSDGALREGVMYDMLGRFSSEDVRDRSVQALMKRYSVDKAQAKRVVVSSHQLFHQVKDKLQLASDDADLLRRVSYLHEIGLAISHSGYHKHGAYLLEHSDIPGFSKVDQIRMSIMVLSHRKKLKSEVYQYAKVAGGDSLINLCLLLRLAILLNHGRIDFSKFPVILDVKSNSYWHITLEKDSEFTLLLADLTEEVAYFEKWGIELKINAQ